MSEFLNIDSVMGNYNSIQLGNARDELNKSLDTFVKTYVEYNNKNPQDNGQKASDSQRILNIKNSLDQLQMGSDIEFDANRKNENSNNYTTTAQITKEGLLERIIYEFKNYGVNFIKSTDIIISRMEQLTDREKNFDEFMENKMPRSVSDIVQKLVSNGKNMLEKMSEVEKNGFQHFFKKLNTKKNEGLKTPPRLPPRKKQKSEKETPKKANIDIIKQIYYNKLKNINPIYKHGLYLLESNISIFDKKLEKDVMRRWQDYMKSKEEIIRVYKIGKTSKGVVNRYSTNPTLNILPPILAGWHCVLFFGVKEEGYSVIEKLEKYIVDTHGLLGRGHGQTEMIFNVSREDIKNICESKAKYWSKNDYEIFTGTILVQKNQELFFEQGFDAISALLGLNDNNSGSSHRNLNKNLELKNVDSELKLETLKF